MAATLIHHKEQLVIGTASDVFVFGGCEVPLPKDAKLGIIVDREDWENPNLDGIFGEAVFIRLSDRKIVFPRADEAIGYTVFKTCKSHEILASIKGVDVIWVR